MRALSGSVLPEYKFSSYRFFDVGEKHVTRVCGDDVLLIVFSGVLRFSENGEPVEVGAGEYYIQEKGIYQSGDVTSDQPVYYYIHFSGNFEVNGSCYLEKRGKFDTFLLHNLIKNLETAKGSDSNMIEIYKAFLSITSALAGGRETTDDSLSYKLYKYVRDNLKNEISLDVLSERFGYCKNYIIKLFKREFGQTPYEYVTSRRIDFAKSLLISSELSLSQIAAESGFVTYINFYKTFIKTEKCSPGDFRRSKINTV